MSTQPLIERLTATTEAYLHRAAPLLRAERKSLPRIDLRFDLRGKAAGLVQRTGDGRITIRYNLAMAQLQPEGFISQTVPHEVAHVVAGVCHGRVKPHGAEWQSVMTFFGIADPARCHDFDLSGLALRSQQRWPYRCGCMAHQLTTTRHLRIQRNQQRYLCRRCGQPLHFSPMADSGL